MTNFAFKSRHKAITDLKTKYEKEIQPVERRSWMEYWNQMAQDGTWVDHIFVQMTAWFMGLNIMILSTSSLPKDPFIFISGNIDNTPSPSPTMLIGNYTNVHFQSLLQNGTTLKQEEKPESIDIEVNEEELKTDDFIYRHNKEKIVFQTFDSGKFECSYCKKIFTRIVTHINCKNCQIFQINIDIDEFRSQINQFKEGFRLELGRK